MHRSSVVPQVSVESVQPAHYCTDDFVATYHAALLARLRHLNRVRLLRIIAVLVHAIQPVNRRPSSTRVFIAHWHHLHCAVVSPSTGAKFNPHPTHLKLVLAGDSLHHEGLQKRIAVGRFDRWAGVSERERSIALLRAVDGRTPQTAGIAVLHC